MKIITGYSIQACFAVLFITIASSFFNPLSAQTTLLYGMTNGGGTMDSGTIISFNTANNTESVVWNFVDSTDGINPQGNLVYYPGYSSFYATTLQGGHNGAGTIINFSPNDNEESVVWNFGTNYDGAYPFGNLTYDTKNGSFYAMTNLGGIGAGTIISFNPTFNGETAVWNFGNDSDGAFPTGSLTYDTSNGLFYGMTELGGNNGLGTIISFNPTTSRDSVLWNFGNGTDGVYPLGSFVYDGGNGLFYAMISAGGQNGNGAIISFNPATNTENVVWSFAGEPSDGADPYGNLVYNSTNGLFYAMTYAGGSNNLGTIITFDANSNKDSVIWSFAGEPSDGANPYGNLVYDSTAGIFYAMTYSGGNDTLGTIISFNPATNKDTLLWSFGNGTDGANPYGDLSLYSGPTGINTITSTAASINIYPNPTNGVFTITGLKTGQIIELYNYLGQLITKSVTTNITQTPNLSAQPNGIYLVRILNADGTLVAQRKVVKTT